MRVTESVGLTGKGIPPEKRAMKLLEDFWREVYAVLDELGVKR
jgi:hypothetical protein